MNIRNWLKNVRIVWEHTAVANYVTFVKEQIKCLNAQVYAANAVDAKIPR